MSDYDYTFKINVKMSDNDLIVIIDWGFIAEMSYSRTILYSRRKCNNFGQFIIPKNNRIHNKYVVKIIYWSQI